MPSLPRSVDRLREVSQPSLGKMDERPILLYGQLVRSRPGQRLGGDGRDGDGLRTVVVLDRGDVIQPLTGKPQPPAPLDAPPLDPNSTEDRREYLAKWLTSPQNPYFTRSIANRVWTNFFCVGIVHPVDDMRSSNPPSNTELLDALSDFLVQEKFDLKALMRVILESETYQRSSLVNDQNSADKRHYTHYYPKRLMAEVIHDAICQVTDVPTRFSEIEYLGATNAQPTSTRKGLAPFSFMTLQSVAISSRPLDEVNDASPANANGVMNQASYRYSI